MSNKSLNEHTGKAHAHNWKGGSVASNGYKLIYVGKGHHLADVRGYAYEHRLVAEQVEGRQLQVGEEVHHEDQDKLNNGQGNLTVKASHAEHFLAHRTRDDLRLPWQPNESIACACGCGEMLLKYDESNRPRRYVTGHNSPPSPAKDAVLAAVLGGMQVPKQIASALGMSLPMAKSTLSRLAKDGKIVHRARGVYGPLGSLVVVRENPIIGCACGCGATFPRLDSSGRLRRYVSGHNPTSRRASAR